MAGGVSGPWLSRVLHAGYLFEHEGTRVLFDPLFETPFSRVCHAFPAVEFDRAAIRAERFDAVFISHYHDDHLSLESLDLIARETPLYLFSVHEEFFALLRELGFREVRALDLNLPVRVGGIEVTPRPALDADVDSVFEIRAGGVSVLNVVDAWLAPETVAKLAARGPWDLVLWPFQTMREVEALCPDRRAPATGEVPPEWREQWRALAPRVMVPSSCQFRFAEGSWLNAEFFPISYAGFARQVREVLPQTQVLRMDPGSRWELGAAGVRPAEVRPAGRLPWVRLRDEGEVDYAYEPGAVPPTTAELAAGLGAWTPEMRARVRAWIAAQDFAAAPGWGEAWRLSVFDEHGGAESFDYRRDGESWRPAAFDERSVAENFDPRGESAQGRAAPAGFAPDVITEIPGVKLHAVLETGESLTSIAARVRPMWQARPGRPPAATAEARPLDAEDFDPLEDPLLRALYAGDVAAYQRGQLRRLRNRG